MILYALHYGTRRNQFYALYARPPLVTTREVVDGRTGRKTTLYESPDKIELNVCVSGFERLIGKSIPLGAVIEILLEAKE